MARSLVFVCCAALCIALLHAEDDPPPPFDAPEPTPTPKVVREEPEPPSATFGLAHGMKTREQKRQQEWSKKKLEENAAKLKRIEDAFAQLTAPRLTLYSIESNGGNDHPTDELNTVAHDPAKGMLYGWKVHKSVQLKPEDAAEFKTAMLNRDHYGALAMNCFYPGMAAHWTDEKGNFVLAVICLHCMTVKFCWKDTVLSIPFSHHGRLAHCDLYLKYFPDPAFETWVSNARDGWLKRTQKAKK